MILDRLQSTAPLDVFGKRVLLRADLNVPVEDGKVSDATRLERLVPSLRDLAERGARVIVISHFGRPRGERDGRFSLRPVADTLAELLHQPLTFAEDCIGEPAERAVASLGPHQIAVLENLRFHKGEEKNDRAFAERLAALGDIFVNDAFSAAHRAHASTSAITRLLPSYAGPLLIEEIKALRSVLENPARPTAAVIGGAKVSSKIELLQNLAAKVDTLIVGGGMANTFLLAQGIEIGKSLAEPDFARTARAILQAAKEHQCEVLLPGDVVVASELVAGAPAQTLPARQTPPEAMILDIGAQTVANYVGAIEASKTLVWNGPLGAFEVEPFGAGTFAVARRTAELTQAGRLVSVAGGGDTVAALNAAGVSEAFSYVSTAGGAFLEWLEGRQLPGIVALAEQPL